MRHPSLSEGSHLLLAQLCMEERFWLLSRVMMKVMAVAVEVVKEEDHGGAAEKLKDGQKEDKDVEQVAMKPT